YVERKINGMITDFMRKIKRFKYEIKKIKSDAEKSLFADLYKYNKEFQERGAEKVKTFVKGSRITLYRKYDPETGKFSGKFVVTQKKVPLLEDNMDTLQDLEKACRYAIKKGYLLKKVYT
ncbi:hypothetical protein KY328_04750, partial [Candidatus Woesearchaeota archaeon]|nr:hypothetical protein [Candidatus Woesearchaeota archaeon]